MINLPESTTVGSKSTITARGTCWPAPVDEKKVENESSFSATDPSAILNSFYSSVLFINELLYRSGIHARLGPRTTRCELVRYFSDFIGPGTLWSECQDPVPGPTGSGEELEAEINR